MWKKTIVKTYINNLISEYFHIKIEDIQEISKRGEM